MVRGRFQRASLKPSCSTSRSRPVLRLKTNDRALAASRNRMSRLQERHGGAVGGVWRFNCGQDRVDVLIEIGLLTRSVLLRSRGHLKPPKARPGKGHHSAPARSKRIWRLSTSTARTRCNIGCLRRALDS
jgi:hypothetical protein